MAQILTLSVPDLSCGHCRASITEALKPLGADPVFDMDARRVEVTTEAPAPEVIAALDRIGFPARPV